MFDYTEFIKTAKEAADISRKILSKHRDNHLYSNFNFETKEDASPVTEVDRRVERQVREFIQERHPDHGIYGEEYGKSSVDREFTWVIDPIDGTKHFITGVPTYSSLIALCHFDKPVIGVIDFPAIKERWIGVKDRQTTLNGQKISTKACKELSEAILSTSNPESIAEEHVQGFKKLIESTKFRLYGASSYAYACQAAGRIDVSVDSGEMEPTDYCAIVPVIEGAGGVITDWDGLPLTINSGHSVVAAGDPALHSKVLEVLAEKN